jgi:hypothetical protein
MFTFAQIVALPIRLSSYPGPGHGTDVGAGFARVATDAVLLVAPAPGEPITEGMPLPQASMSNRFSEWVWDARNDFPVWVATCQG